MNKIVLGIHENGAATKVVVMDSDLKVLALAEGKGPQQVIRDAIEVARIQSSDIVAIGISGESLYPPSPMYGGKDFGVKEIFPNKAPVVNSEGASALLAGAGRRFGIVMICDDSPVAYGSNEQGEQFENVGTMISPASRYDIGRHVFQAMRDAEDGIGGQTRLSGHVSRSMDMLIELERTDAVASGIILHTADRLAAQTRAVATRLKLNDKRFPLIMAGNLFHRSELLRTLFVQAVQAQLPGAVPQLLTLDYAVCAAMSALHTLGVPLPQPDLDSYVPPRRATERRNPLTVDIQSRPTLDFVRLMNAEDQRVPRLIEPELEHIAALIDLAAERFDKGGRLFFVGAGTSGRLAVLDAAECRPTFGTTPDEVLGILAGGEAAMIHSIEGAEDDEAQGRAEIASRNVGKLDTVIGVAASGSTPFVVGAVREAQDRGALTGCIVNNAGSIIASLVQHPIVIPTGPEVIMGSTRLKAGTAQKLVLNMISTGVMMRVGRTYGNLMTDMQMSNVKLRKRAAVIVAEATELPLDEATALLDRCDNEMKTAIASYLLKLSPEDARARLKQFNGNLYRCLRDSR